jgi:hypothetical protein
MVERRKSILSTHYWRSIITASSGKLNHSCALLVHQWLVGEAPEVSSSVPVLMNRNAADCPCGISEISGEPHLAQKRRMTEPPLSAVS